jgi:hypothetical protein
MKRIVIRTAALATALLYGVQAQAAASCSGRSPAHAVALLELYTSEGCDSCPPADHFVSGLRAAGVAQEQAVLLSLHVDYWNYIGWKDVFSRAAFTERQRYLSDLAGSRTIYTPELFVAGQELRGGSERWKRGVPEAVKRINGHPAQADISINLGAPGAAGLPLEVHASAQAGGKLYVALVESGIDSQVRAGENRGLTLHHDYVVREWLTPAPLAADGKSPKPMASVARTVPLPAGALPKNLGVAAFVQTERGEVLQAYTLPVCGS